MIPPQLEEEIEAFRAAGQPISVIEDGSRCYVIFSGFRLPDGVYTPTVSDVMIMADYQYPMSRLDMFWTDPVVTLASGSLPQNADQFEEFAGRRWQRWSYHYEPWNPNCHNLGSHIEVFCDRLAKGT